LPALKEALLSALREIKDPEVGLNVLDLGLVYRVDFDREKGAVLLKLTLTTPACPMGDALVEGIRRRLLQVEGVEEVRVELVFDPPWTPARITPEGRAELGRMGRAKG